MTIGKILLCLYLTSLAVHYGWRMRGSVIGGEKGAMLPGMLAGLVLSQFAGGEIARYYFIPAAAGLIGMSYGGIEPYGDSIALIEDPDYVKPNPKKGLAGLALKGALWFSIAGGFIGMSFNAINGVYSIYDAIAFTVSVIFAQIIGYRIFNWPYDPEKKIFPKIYLSFESRDEWGSNIGVLVVIAVFSIIKKDVITALMSLCGLIFGAIGWIVAMKMYHYTDNPLKNGKYLCGCFKTRNLVGGWGNMEYCLGSFGGFGIALGFILSWNTIQNINYNRVIGNVSPITESTVITAILLLFMFALLLINIYEYRCDLKGKKYNSFVMDCIERPFFNTLPFTFILVCSLTASKIMSAFMIVYCLFIKNAFDRLKPGKSRNAFIIICGLICIADLVACILIDHFSFIWLVIAGTIPYLICESLWKLFNKRNGGIKNFFKLNGFTFNIILLSVQSIVLITISIVYLIKC